MILSKYNYFYESNELCRSILVNYLNGKIIVFKDKANEQFKNYLVNDMNSPEIEKFLFENGYLVNKDINESAEIERVERIVHDHEAVLSLVLVLTESCNLRCIYCCENHWNSRMSSTLQDQIVEFVEANIYRYKCLKVEWFGGEPLLCMDIIESLSRKFIDICQRNRVQYFAVTSTNGFLLNTTTLEKLKELRVLAFQITIDGLKETHDAQRMQIDGTGSWDIIVGNLRDIRDNFKSNLISLVIRTNVTYPICEIIDQYMDFLLNEFGADNRFSFLWRIAEDWGNIEEGNKKILCGTKEYAK